MSYLFFHRFEAVSSLCEMEQSFQRQSRFGGSLLQRILASFLARRLFADFPFRAGQIARVIFHLAIRDTDSRYNQQSVLS